MPGESLPTISGGARPARSKPPAAQVNLQKVVSQNGVDAASSCSQGVVSEMPRLVSSLLTLSALCVLFSACASTCRAGILLPEQVTFGVSDLEKALDSGMTGATSNSSDSSSSPRHRHDWPSNDPNQPTNPLELVRSSLPTGSSSSGTSTSSTGAIGSGVVLCALNSTLNLRDDSPRGSLAEELGLLLPEAPGTDLLRPPRP